MKKNLLFLLLLTISITACEEIIMEDDISGETVHLIAPYNGAEFYSTGITFTWDAIENGSQYRIQIARPNFENPLEIVSDQIIDTTSFTTQLNIGNYEWRVQGVNSSYKTAYSKRVFTIISNEDFQNNNVTLSSPSNNIITNSASQNLTWQSVLGATGYQVQVINSSDSSIIHDEMTSATNWNYSFPEGSYQWRVRATNGEQNTLYSSRNIFVDTLEPNMPVLNTPANQSNTSDNDITFQWTRIPIAGTPEKDSIYIFSNSQLTNLIYENEEISPYNTSALEEGTYYWYVKSFDEAGNVSPQSNVFSFTLN